MIVLADFPKDEELSVNPIRGLDFSRFYIINSSQFSNANLLKNLS